MEEQSLDTSRIIDHNNQDGQRSSPVNCSNQRPIKDHIAIAVSPVVNDNEELDYDDVPEYSDHEQFMESDDEGNSASDGNADISETEEEITFKRKKVAQTKQLSEMSEKELLEIPNVQSILSKMAKEQADRTLVTTVFNANTEAAAISREGQGKNKKNVVKLPSDTTLYMPALKQAM